MKLPLYYIVGDRPVKAVATPEGGMEILAYEWATGEFQREMSYLDRLFTGDAEVDEVGEQEFEEHVAALRRRPRRGASRAGEPS